MTSTDYLLPHLPFGGAECIIVRWLKRVGEPLSAGEPLVVVVNDRLESALPVLEAGILERTLADEGAVVAAGAAVAIIADHLTTSAGAQSEAASVPIPAANQPVDAPTHEQHIAVRAARISPVARRIADLENIDITDVAGTGVSGRIIKADILAALANPHLPSPIPHLPSPISHLPSPIPHPPSPIPHPPSPIPYVLTAVDVDLERVAKLIEQREPGFARRRLELSYPVWVAQAAVAALPDHPFLNSSWDAGMIVLRRRVHLAFVPADRALIRYVYDAQDLNMRGLARRLDRAAAEHTGEHSTFTIVELGDRDWGDPSAWACGAAALGIGAVRARPLAIDDAGADRLVVRHAALLTLAYDARVLDQSNADAFLCDIKRRLERISLEFRF